MKIRSEEVETQLADWETCDMPCRQQADRSSCGVFVLMVSNLTIVICQLMYAAVQFTFKSANIVIMILIYLNKIQQTQMKRCTCTYLQ